MRANQLYEFNFQILHFQVESFLKEVLDEEIVFQNPLLQRTKDGLLDLFEGLSTLCSAVSPSREVLQVPELPTGHSVSSYEMKFIKGTSPGEMWLCYVDNGEFLNVLKRLKYEKPDLHIVTMKSICFVTCRFEFTARNTKTTNSNRLYFILRWENTFISKTGRIYLEALFKNTSYQKSE